MTLNIIKLYHVKSETCLELILLSHILNWDFYKGLKSVWSWGHLLSVPYKWLKCGLYATSSTFVQLWLTNSKLLSVYMHLENMIQFAIDAMMFFRLKNLFWSYIHFHKLENMQGDCFLVLYSPPAYNLHMSCEVITFFFFFVNLLMQVAIKLNSFVCAYTCHFKPSHLSHGHFFFTLLIWKPEQSSEYFFPSNPIVLVSITPGLQLTLVYWYLLILLPLPEASRLLLVFFFLPLNRGEKTVGFFFFFFFVG